MPPKIRQVLGKVTRAGRAEVRQDAGRLRDNRVNGKTLQRYTAACMMFQWWLFGNGTEYAAGWDELDLQLCSFLESLWEDGESKGIANDVLSGTQHFLLTRRRLQGAWQLLTTWGRLELPCRAPPMLSHIALAIAGLAISIKRVDYAALILLTFHCFLRSGELYTVRPNHITLQSNRTGVIALPWTKVGQQRGAQEMVTIDDPFVGYWLSVACNLAQADSPLLNGSPHQFRVFFFKACAALGVADLKFKPYSLRRGGATFDFLTHKDIARTVLRGRWGDIRTARIYITDGAATIATVNVTPGATELITHYVSLLYSAVIIR
jgi:hypothetical protein